MDGCRVYHELWKMTSGRICDADKLSGWYCNENCYFLAKDLSYAGVSSDNVAPLSNQTLLLCRYKLCGPLLMRGLIGAPIPCRLAVSLLSISCAPAPRNGTEANDYGSRRVGFANEVLHIQPSLANGKPSGGRLFRTLDPELNCRVGI